MNNNTLITKWKCNYLKFFTILHIDKILNVYFVLKGMLVIPKNDYDSLQFSTIESDNTTLAYTLIYDGNNELYR